MSISSVDAHKLLQPLGAVICYRKMQFARCSDVLLAVAIHSRVSCSFFSPLNFKTQLTANVDAIPSIIKAKQSWSLQKRRFIFQLPASDAQQPCEATLQVSESNLAQLASGFQMSKKQQQHVFVVYPPTFVIDTASVRRIPFQVKNDLAKLHLLRPNALCVAIYIQCTTKTLFAC